MRLEFHKKNLTDLMVLLGTLSLYSIAAYLYIPNNLALLDFSPHPFIFFSVLYSAYYGLKHALVSSAVYSLFYLGLISQQVDFQEVESLFLISYLKLPIFLTFLSVLVGEIRQRTFVRNKDNVRKLETQGTINKELKNKLNLASVELKEMQKRYATLTESFAGNVQLIEALDNKTFEQVINICKSYLIQECQIGVVHFYGRNDLEVPSEERKVIENLKGHKEVYTIKDDLLGEEKVLTHVSAEIVVPLVVMDEIIGHFFLSKVPFLSMNIFNQKKIENAVRITEISLNNNRRIETWQENSSILYPYDIYKKAPFFEEMARFKQNIGHLFDAAKEELLYSEVSFNWQDDISHHQRKKVVLLLCHLAKNDRKGVSFTGGAPEEQKFYLSFLSSAEDAKLEMQQIISQLKGLLPDGYGDKVEITFTIHKIESSDPKGKLVCLT